MNSLTVALMSAPLIINAIFRCFASSPTPGLVYIPIEIIVQFFCKINFSSFLKSCCFVTNKMIEKIVQILNHFSLVLSDISFLVKHFEI